MLRFISRTLAVIGALAFLLPAGIIATGAPIPLLTVAGSGCNEASQLLFCLNTLITTLNGGGQTGMISLFTGGTSSSGAINGTDPVSTPCVGGLCTVGGVFGPGTSAGSGSVQTPVRLNSQRGVVTFQTPLGNGSNSSTLLVLNTFITASSNCQASILSSGAPPAAVVSVSNMTPTVSVLNGASTAFAGLAINIGNANPLAQAGGLPTATYNIGYWCQ